VADIATKERVSGALPTLPRRTDGISLAALLFAGFCVLCAWGTTHVIGEALEYLAIDRGALWNLFFALVILGTAALFWPASRALAFSNRARMVLPHFRLGCCGAGAIGLCQLHHGQ
jgi:polar amino acid transport system permease protein